MPWWCSLHSSNNDSISFKKLAMVKHMSPAFCFGQIGNHTQWIKITIYCQSHTPPLFLHTEMVTYSKFRCCQWQNCCQIYSIFVSVTLCRLGLQLSRATYGNIDVRSGYVRHRYCGMGLLPDTWSCALHMHREYRERCPRHWLQRKTLVTDPGMHHSTCVTHVT